MANAVSSAWLEALLAATLTHTIKASIMGPSYVYSPSHDTPSDLTDVIGTVTLSGLVAPGGVLDANDAIASGLTVEAMKSVWVYDDTDSLLIVFFDQGVGFDANPAGDVNIIWPDDVNIKIFPLGGRP